MYYVFVAVQFILVSICLFLCFTLIFICYDTQYWAKDKIEPQAIPLSCLEQSTIVCCSLLGWDNYRVHIQKLAFGRTMAICPGVPQPRSQGISSSRPLEWAKNIHPVPAIPACPVSWKYSLIVRGGPTWMTCHIDGISTPIPMATVAKITLTLDWQGASSMITALTARLYGGLWKSSIPSLQGTNASGCVKTISYFTSLRRV